MGNVWSQILRSVRSRPVPSSSLWDPYPTSTYKPEDLRNKIGDLQRKSSIIRPDQKFRIVVCARGRDGKSSSINNILAALEGEYSQTANEGGQEEHVTTEYTEYDMLIGEENSASYVICDTPGLRDGVSGDETTVQTEAIKAAIMGKFQHKEEIIYENLTVAELEAKAIRQERAVCVIFAIDIRKVHQDVIDNSEAFQSMKTILTFTQNKNISVACLLTHCDELDTQVKKDVSNIYSSPLVEEARQKLKLKFNGFPGHRIFPIVNYTESLQVENNMMVLSLFALKHIMSDIHSNLRKIKR